MIPEFPEFKNLELTDKEEIENLTRQFPPYSDFHFVTIYCWDIDNNTLISRLNENLIIKQIDCLSCEQYFSFIGINSVQKTIEQISVYLIQHKLPLIFRWMPDVTVNCINGLEATITDDRDYFDYIYKTEDLHSAEGHRYKRYRKAISHFTRNYHRHITTRMIDLSCNDELNRIKNLYKVLSAKKISDEKEFDSLLEYKALNKLLSTINDFNSVFALGIFHKNEIIAFAFENIVDCDYGCGIFWKANTNYKGLYQFLQKEITRIYHNKGIKFMSWESDLGILTLRESKMHYNPAFFLKKYKIELCIPN